MKSALAGAWLFGTGLVIWRQLAGSGGALDVHWPSPGSLLGVTGLFAALGLASDAVPAAAPLILAGAWGIDIAGLLRLWPSGLGARIEQATGAASPASGPAAKPPAGPAASAAASAAAAGRRVAATGGA